MFIDKMLNYSSDFMIDLMHSMDEMRQGGSASHDRVNETLVAS